MKDLYIHLPRRPRFMAVPLACALLLAGCGGGSDEPEPTHTSRYPTLAAHASMDEEDFDRYLLTAGRGTNITPESDPSRVVWLLAVLAALLLVMRSAVVCRERVVSTFSRPSSLSRPRSKMGRRL